MMAGPATMASRAVMEAVPVFCVPPEMTVSATERSFAYGSDNVDKKQTYIYQVLNCCKIPQIKKHNNTEWIKSHPYLSRLLMFISDYAELLMNVSTFERDLLHMDRSKWKVTNKTNHQRTCAVLVADCMGHQ